MLSIKGVYDGKEIKLLQPIPTQKKIDVIITFLDDDWDDKNTVAEQYKSYYQNLTSEEAEEDSNLAREFQSIDLETDRIIEDKEV